MDNTQQFHHMEALAKQLFSLKQQSQLDQTLFPQYQQLQNKYMPQFQPLIERKTRKYKTFPNYQDLNQEGYEALLMALNTYHPAKGSFTWWANYYIGLKVARAANAYSVIKIPIRRAGKLKPIQQSMPVMLDEHSTVERLEQNEIEAKLKTAVSHLTPKLRKLLRLAYGFSGEPLSLKDLSLQMAWSRQKCLKMLKQAEEKLKQILL